MQAQPFIARLERDLGRRREFRVCGRSIFGSLVEGVGGEGNLRAVEFPLKVAELLPAEPQTLADSPFADAFERFLQRSDGFRVGERRQAVGSQPEFFITCSFVR